MNRLLVGLVLVVAVVVGLGFYRGWFDAATDSADGKSHLNITVDKDKIKEDEEKVVKKIHNVEHQVKDKVTAPAVKDKD
jgi:hypothetical protein